MERPARKPRVRAVEKDEVRILANPQQRLRLPLCDAKMIDNEGNQGPGQDASSTSDGFMSTLHDAMAVRNKLLGD